VEVYRRELPLALIGQPLNTLSWFILPKAVVYFSLCTAEENKKQFGRSGPW
jgi:hypothetical protein